MPAMSRWPDDATPALRRAAWLLPYRENVTNTTYVVSCQYNRMFTLIRHVNINVVGHSRGQLP